MGMQIGGGGGDDLNAEINVTPFVDVMLVLLVIFMITAPMMNTGVDIALPQVTAENIEEAEHKVILSIDKGRNLTLLKEKLLWSDLAVTLAGNQQLQTEKELYVEADQTLPYGVVVTAMGIAKQAGIDNVMLLTDPSEHIDVGQLDSETTAVEKSE